MKIAKEQIENARKILAKYETENGVVTVSYTPQGATNCSASCMVNCNGMCNEGCTGCCTGSCSNVSRC